MPTTTSSHNIAKPTASLLLLALLATLPACKDEQPPAKTPPPPTAAIPTPPPATPPAGKPAPRSSIQSSTPAAPGAPGANPPALPAGPHPSPAQTAAPAVDPSAPPTPTVSSNFPNNRIYSRTQSTRDATLTPETGPLIESGSGILIPPALANPVDAEIIVKGIKAPKQFAVVQFPVAGEQAYSYWKAAINNAANIQPIFLEDSDGQAYTPMGYFIDKGNSLEFKLDPQQGFRTASQIPGIKTLEKNQTIWIVFFVPKGTQITRFVASGTHKLPVDLKVP
jgi:hypothetical protein